MDSTSFGRRFGICIFFINKNEQLGLYNLEKFMRVKPLNLLD